MATRIIEMVGIEPHRRFSNDDKARILSEVIAPGASVLEVAGVPLVLRPEPLGPGVMEVVSPARQRVRLAPPIDARVLKTVLAGLA